MLILTESRELAQKVIATLGANSCEFWDLSIQPSYEYVKPGAHADNVIVLLAGTPEERIANAVFVCHYCTLTKQPKILVDVDDKLGKALLEKGYVQFIYSREELDEYLKTRS